MEDKDLVRFRFRERKDGIKAILLVFYHKGKRHEESLRLYLVPEITREDKKKNKETMAIAETVRARRLVELQGNAFKLKAENPDVYLLEFWQEKIAVTQSEGNRAQWVCAYRHMTTYLKGKDVLLRDIDVKFVEGYKAHLASVKTFAGYGKYKDLKSNSQLSYFAKFRSLLKSARRLKYIDENPSELVKAPKMEEAERAYLTMDELRALIDTPCAIESVRVAFLFSCLTGLRRSDILKLTWGEVSEQEGFTRLTFRQQKTTGLQYLDINEQAAQLMGDRKGAKEYVFDRLPANGHTNHTIRTWAATAGIKKWLTFHSGRHTFATMMLSLDTDLYTVSKLLGHKEINTTQIYAKVLDKNRQAAVKKIPDLNL